MYFGASKFLFLTLCIYFVGIITAMPKGDDGSVTPSDTDEDSTSDKIPELNAENTAEKNLEEKFKKIEEEVVSEAIAEKEKELEEEIAKETPFTEKPSETEEEAANIPETKEEEPANIPETKEEEPANIPETKEEEPTNETPEEKQVTTPVASAVVNKDGTIEKEEAPKDTFAVWSAKGKICLLAKFDAVFSILYSSQRGEEKAEVTIPKNAVSKGKCGSNARLPLLQISWGKYSFTMMFNKTDEESWAVTSMELAYDTAEPLFDGAVNAGKKTARSKAVTLFETSIKNSYFCPAQETILLYAGNKQVVTGRIRKLQLQPFEVENGEFSPTQDYNKGTAVFKANPYAIVIILSGMTFFVFAYYGMVGSSIDLTQRCSNVVIDEETPYVQDETVPFAIGCTLALITMIILVGFSIHRAYHAAKVDYNSME